MEPAGAAAPSVDDLLGLSLEELMQVPVRVASRIPTTALNAGSSVEVIPEAAWQRRGARTVADVLEAVPGVSVTPGLGASDVFAIRGFPRSMSLLGVLVSWDGVPLNDMYRGSPTLNVPNLSLGAIDEIQMIEGPGSALYGADAFHGVIALDPYESSTDEHSVHANLRSNDSYSVGARFGYGVGDDIRMSTAITADGQSDQNLQYRFTDPTTGLPLGGERENEFNAQSVSLKVSGRAGDGLTWRTGMLAHRSDGDGFQGYGTRLAGVRDVASVDANLQVIDGALRLERREDGAAFEVAAYAWHSDSALFAGRNTYDLDLPNQQRRWGVHATYEKSLVGAQTQIAVAVGVEELSVQKARLRNYDAVTGALTLDLESASQGAGRHIQSATFEGGTHWSDDRWRLVYGARIDHYSDFGSQASPRVGLIWRPQPRNAIKLLYGTAFRAPTAIDLHGSIGVIAPNPDLDPEEIDTVEFIVMHQADSWVMQGSLFQSDWHNAIVQVPTVVGIEPFVYTNLDENRAHGITWELNWQGDPWLVNLGATWTRSENRTRSEDYSAFPRYIVHAEAGYRHAPWKTTFYLTEQVQLRTDDVFPPSAGFEDTRLPTYSRTDIGGIRPLSARVNLLVFVRNLFDRDNVYSSSAGSRGGIPDYSRTLSAEIRVSF